MRDLTGEQFGPYRIVGPVGEGGMAAVYKAYQPSMDRYVALKVLHPFFVEDPSFKGRFEQEAKVLGKLQHIHILPTYDYGAAGEYVYIVMPFIDTGTLADRLRAGPLSPSEVHGVVSQIGSALDFAHSLGIVHRDVKPSNILMDNQGNCLLTDFGIAKMVEATSVFTQTGGTIGTPAYMSPEQIRGEKLDGRSDLYSLGIVLYEMATGRPPFQAETPPAVFMKHLLDPLPPPSKHNPSISEGMERVILKALAKDPSHRFQTGCEMANSLARGPVGKSSAATASPDYVRPPATRQVALSPPRPRLPAWAIGVIAVAVIAGPIAVWAALSGPGEPDASLASEQATAESLTGTAIAVAALNPRATALPPSPTATAPPTPRPSDTLVPPSTWTPTVPASPTPIVAKPTRVPTKPEPYVLAGDDGVNVRSGPGTSFPVIDSLPARGQAAVSGKYGSWWRIEIGGQLGWVYRDVVTATNTEDVPEVQPPPSPTPVPTATSMSTQTPTATPGSGGPPPPPPPATDTPLPVVPTATR